MLESMSSQRDDMELSQFEFKRNRTCFDYPLARNVLGLVYDVFTIVVSLLDIITDVIVLIEFYLHGHMAFFYCSLIILLMAQLSYTVAFWWKFKEAPGGDGGILTVFICKWFQKNGCNV